MLLGMRHICDSPGQPRPPSSSSQNIWGRMRAGNFRVRNGHSQGGVRSTTQNADLRDVRTSPLCAATSAASTDVAAAATAALMCCYPQPTSRRQSDARSQRQRVLLPSCQPESATLVQPADGVQKAEDERAGMRRTRTAGRCRRAAQPPPRPGPRFTANPCRTGASAAASLPRLPDERHLHLAQCKLPACRAEPGERALPQHEATGGQRGTLGCSVMAQLARCPPALSSTHRCTFGAPAQRG